LASSVLKRSRRAPRGWGRFLLAGSKLERLLPSQPELFRGLGLFRCFLHGHKLAVRLAAFGLRAGAGELGLHLRPLLHCALAGIVARWFVRRHSILPKSAAPRRRGQGFRLPKGRNDTKMLCVRLCSATSRRRESGMLLKRPWTEEDDQKLLALVDAGRSSLSIAAAIKRSKGAVQSRLTILRHRKNDEQNRATEIAAT
jgi:hypothetical protein